MSGALSKITDLDKYRQQSAMNKRMMQNSLILAAAINDARLNRDDLKFLARLLHCRVLYGQMHIRKHAAPESCVRKLQSAGYLVWTIENLSIGFRSTGPEPFYCAELTEREQARFWL